MGMIDLSTECCHSMQEPVSRKPQRRDADFVPRDGTVADGLSDKEVRNQ